MAELSTVARPYAEALFAAARDGKADLQAWADLLGQMAQVVANPDVREAMSDPRLDDGQRLQVFLGLIQRPSDQLPPAVLNFVELLMSNGRILLLPNISVLFTGLMNRHEGTAQAEITSAFELAETQVADLVSALEVKFGLKLRPHVTVDPSLIGGVRVAVGDQVLDTSVQAQLARMRDTLAA
jgi:F-type H+-transporting ATPase subunit delta